jgi:hypothetical protein
MSIYQHLFPGPRDYAWIITHDLLADPATDDSYAVGIMGPKQAPDDLVARVKAGEGHTFKLYDDDGIHYYTGRLLTTGDPADEQYCYAPLQDFGEGWAGCVEVRWPGHSNWDCG